MAEIQPMVAGNWKMNGLSASLDELDEICRRLDVAGGASAADVMICPPATLVAGAAARCGGRALQIGAQDCHAGTSGAHTGDVSCEMLRDAGATAVIVGHSERRADHCESSEAVREKALAARRAGLRAIVCVGETQAQRRAGETLGVVSEQVAGSMPDGAETGAEGLIVAYEPVWAIGTGLTPTRDDIAEVHGAIRAQLIDLYGAREGGAMRILYGGSVKPGNAVELMGIANVNGALVGGASLKADDFCGIIAAYQAV